MNNVLLDFFQRAVDVCSGSRGVPAPTKAGGDRRDIDSGLERPPGDLQPVLRLFHKDQSNLESIDGRDDIDQVRIVIPRIPRRLAVDQTQSSPNHATLVLELRE